MQTATPLRVLAVGSRRFAVNLPHLAFASAIAAWCAWFCADAVMAQRDVENLILIVPAAIVALVLYGFVAASCFQPLAGAAPPGEAPERPLAPGIGVKIAGTMALLAAYAAAGPTIGFDVCTFAYILAMLWFLGERRILVLLLVPAVFCAFVIYCFGTILATPLPVLLFGGDGS